MKKTLAVAASWIISVAAFPYLLIGMCILVDSIVGAR